MRSDVGQMPFQIYFWSLYEIIFSKVFCFDIKDFSLFDAVCYSGIEGIS
jgi:hypothetical protein